MVPKRGFPPLCAARLQTRSIVSFQWSILFAESWNRASGSSVGIPVHFSAACLVLSFYPQPTSSLKQPTTFVWIYRAVMARVQTQAGRISRGPASSYSATHNLLVILLGTSDSDVTLLQPGSWWDRVRHTETITLAPIRPLSAEQKAWLQPSFKPWHNQNNITILGGRFSPSVSPDFLWVFCFTNLLCLKVNGL